ncbi:ADP-ribosyltransferase-containing protein [Ruminococcus bromii]|uniref:ADP-ribosyltransferase-containing protein n=1 Tax=Ruminococcus bromii TaxID=40518 RepID=UPI003FD7E101
MTIRKIVSGETEDTTGNNDTGTTSSGMTVNEMFNIINRKTKSNNTFSSTGSDTKSFLNGNLDKANSSAEDFKEAIKNPNKSLDDRVKGLKHMYNAAVATGDTKTAEKMQKEYDELADRVNRQTEINRQNAETAAAENAKLAEQAEKEQKFSDKYKNSTLEQRKNARIHATTEELDWLNKHMYDNSSSKELEDYNNQLNKEANSLWNQRDEEQAYNRLKAIEDEQGKLKTAIDNAKLSEQKKKEYDDIVNNDINAKTVLQKYYALQEYSSNQSLVRSEENTDGVKNQVILDDYNYINKLSGKERNQIVKDFNNLKKEGYDTESLYKWYKRERDAESAAETTRVYTDYADKHPVLGSLQSVGVRLTGAVPDAVKYISTNLDKKYNGGDGYINPEETGTAISDAMRAKVSDNINNDFGSFLYNTGMSMADFASLLPLNAVPGGQALSLGIMGTSAGVGAANEVINNGGTIDNAVKTGIASGIAETLFEKVSLEQLSVFKASGKSTFRAAVGNVLKGAFTEGSEEAVTDLANRLTDDAINKDLSSYNLSKKKYMEQGMSEAEAENAASWDFWKSVGLDFAGGAVSGGVLNLATAGVNLAGAKIDMAQNKESNIQTGKAVMADENFDLDLLIRQGLATDKNDRAYNYAKKMQKLVETKGEGKISAGDVGNLMYLINREVARNPELVNKIAQVKKQNTQEQGNKTVNVQNEQNPTQQNAEQAQASTAINATKKADTEAIGKMYGAYAFGKKHPNGIIATDTSTGKVVKVALKSLESSAKINRNDEENTLVFNTNDGKQVNADSITFSDSQLDTIVHSANEFDTYGARNYISNFEEWRESPQAQKMSDEEMLYKYNRAYSAAYSFGREGVKLDSLKETSEYTILKNILGEQIVSQALSTGRRDVDINTQHHANRLTELINRNGRADTSGVGVYADSGTEVSHIPQELINTLGNLATKTGRNIIISDRLADGVNGVAKDGNIILSSEISSQKILATALHEAGHMIKKTNPTEWQTLSDFVSDYLVRKGVDLNKMIDRTIERYDNRLQADEYENTRDAALEEIVCDTLMSIASDEKALNIALSTKQNKAKIAAAIKSLINKVKDWLIGKSTNYGAKAFAKDLEALENLAQRFSEAADTARENITEQTEVQNGEKIDVEKYSMGSTDNIVQAKFDDNVNKKINNITQSKQFIRWFGDWQNSPAKASKVVDNNGEPLVLYHQTEKEFTAFDTKQKGSGEFDSEMPTGIFMKPTNNDIGVGGNIQMPLYASIKNPLIVNNRSELVKFYDKNVQGYTKAKSAIDSINEEYKAKFDEETKREDEEYQKQSTKNPYQEMHLMKLWKNGKIRLMKQAVTLKLW